MRTRNKYAGGPLSNFKQFERVYQSMLVCRVQVYRNKHKRHLPYIKTETTSVTLNQGV